MAKVLLSGSHNTGSVAASTTIYKPISIGYEGGGSGINTTEANCQITCESAGTYSLAHINIITNDRAASTLNFRKAAANGSQSVSITGSTTGEFNDPTRSDAVAVNDKVNLQLITGAGGTTFTLEVYGIVFAATASTTQRFNAFQVSYSTASQTTFAGLADNPNATAVTEANAQFKVKTAGTLQNLYVFVVTNARTTATVFGTRINGVTGTLTVSYGNAVTGILEDTTHTDTVAVNDLVNLYCTTGTGAQTLQASSQSVELATTNNSWHLINGAVAGIVINISLTRYFNIGGGLLTASATEANNYQTAQIAFTSSFLECFVSANTVTLASTLTSRKNSANGGQSASITASTTGYFQDPSGTDTIVSTDKIGYQLVTGTTGTSLTINNIGILANTPTAVPMNWPILTTSSAFWSPTVS